LRESLQLLIRQIRRQRLWRNTLWRRRNVTQRYRIGVASVLRIHTVVSRVPFKSKHNSKQLRLNTQGAREKPALIMRAILALRRHDSSNAPGRELFVDK
jgi:hypothetical protein